MKVITIINNKGGVGKTTSVQNIGAAISLLCKAKVLLIDLDPQCSLTKSFGITTTNGNIGDLLLGLKTFEEIKITYNKNIDVLPTSQELIHQEQQIANSPAFPFNLKLALEKPNNDYDFIVIDCPPSLGVLTRVALLACNTYLIPMQAEYFSYEGLRSLILYTKDLAVVNKGMALGGVFATRFNPNVKKNFSKYIINSIREQIGGKLLDTCIRENIALSEAQADGKTIFDYNPDCNAAEDYYNLTKEIFLKVFDYNEQK